MYIKVIIGEYTRGESPEESFRSSTEINVNPDCPVKIIHNYIRSSLKIGDELEVDLCDENGTLVFIYEKDPWVNGLNFLIPNTTYYTVIFERDEDNKVTNPMVYLPESVKKPSNQLNEIMSKIKKQINPGLYSKPSRMHKTRLGTSYVK